MTNNIDNLSLATEDIEWILNDDPNDIDNQLLGEDAEILEIVIPERMCEGLSVFKDIGSWSIDNLFNRIIDY